MTKSGSKKCSCFLILLLFSFDISAQLPKGKMLTGKVNNEQFGRNVKLSADGTVLAVAAPLNSEYGDKNGRIEMYKFDGNNWQLIGNQILPGSKDFRYGEMMELSADGKKLFVASPFGGISFYTFDGKDWIKSPQSVQLENESEQIEAISITPDAAVMAVAYECEEHWANCIKLFYFDGSKWQQDGVDLTPFPKLKVYSLSLSLSANGQALVVGNRSKDTKELRNAGQVIFYSKVGNQWIQNVETFFGSEAGTNLGTQVAVAQNGNWVIASSNSLDLSLSAGFVETYKLENNAWVKKSKTLKPEKSNSYFGHAVCISADGNLMALSMPYLRYSKPGYVKVYKNEPTGWSEAATITDTDGVETTSSPNNSTGWAIALSADGKTLAVGFPHNDENGDMSGKVIVYDLSGIR